MDTAKLGRAGLKVSRLGTMNFGPETSEADAWRIMDRALDVGINFFDTADMYGYKMSEWGRLPREGPTEQLIGRWFAQGGGRREKVVLATKVYGRMWEGPNGGGLSALHIRRACDDSLRRLKTDHIDLYQMHHIDRDTPWDEIWQAMEVLVQQGKVLYVGSSNFAGWNIAQASETAARRNFLGLVSEQSLYNLSERTIELEVAPASLAYGLGIIPWSPLGGGLLGGALQKASQGRRSSPMQQQRLAEHRPKVERYEKLCSDLGMKPGDVALAWLLHQPGVTAPIIGPRTMEQLDGALGEAALKLDATVLKQLDEIWPGPGGPAPEAYAW